MHGICLLGQLPQHQSLAKLGACLITQLELKIAIQQHDILLMKLLGCLRIAELEIKRRKQIGHEDEHDQDLVKSGIRGISGEFLNFEDEVVMPSF